MASGVGEARVAFDCPEALRPNRATAVIVEAARQGLIGPKDKTISGRVTSVLVDAAKSRSGIRSNWELLLNALSKVALEDDFAFRLFAPTESVPKDVSLDV